MESKGSSAVSTIGMLLASWSRETGIQGLHWNLPLRESAQGAPLNAVADSLLGDYYDRPREQGFWVWEGPTVRHGRRESYWIGSWRRARAEEVERYAQGANPFGP